MRYVLDASVGLKWVLPEADSDRARRLQRESRAGIHELIAPDFFGVELIHALTRAERKKLIRIGEAVVLFARVLLDLPKLHASLGLLARALEISSQHRVPAYDCIYVAPAEREGCEYVTADLRLLSALGSTFPFIIDLATFPP